MVNTIRDTTIRMTSAPVDPPIIAPSLLVCGKTRLK